MRAAAILLLLAGSACVYPKWVVKSPDRGHSLKVLPLLGGGVRIVRDGNYTAQYGAIALETLRFSPDGKHFTFAAQKPKSDGWIIVADGYESTAFDGIGELLYSPDSRRLAATVEIAGKWHVVVESERSPPFDAIFAGSLTFSADGRHLAFAAGQGVGSHVVVDGAASPAYEGVGGVTFAGPRGVWAARKGARWTLVVAGVEVATHDAIVEIAADPARGRFAYAAKDGAGWVVAREDGAPAGSPGDAGEVRDLRFSADGAHLAYVVRRGVEQHVVLDGAEGPAYDQIGAPIFSPIGARLAYVARKGKTARVVLDGAEQPAQEWVSDPVFSADGSTAAYLYRGTGATTGIALEGKEPIRLGAALEGTLVLSATGKHWAVASGDPLQRTMFIATDVGDAIPVDQAELGARALQAGEPDVETVTAILRDIAAGELERALRPR